MRVTEDNDPAEAWRVHNENFKNRSAWLNAHKFERLEYKSANGTDFKVWLMPESRWCGGGEYTLSGVYYNPNMPTEEIFTTPCKGKAEGTLVSTKPLSYEGQLIENFSIIFKELSVEQSSTSISSKSANVCASRLSMQPLRYFSTL